MVSITAVTNSLVGSLLGKDYRVLEEIGRGGMAVVYLVEHQTLQKKFAAKVLSAEHASSDEARARFTQEAHAASQLDHENIVTISDFGITPDQRPFYVMELLRGRTLMDRIEEGPMSIEEVVAVSVPVARALAHAHAEGVIHRDVKPENVFLVQRSQGRWSVKVLDFGIAKVTTNPALTKMGQALGSPMFMAPEACRGDDVDQRSDLYSFGILLYVMLTGRVPFSDPSLLKVLQMQVSMPVPPMQELNPSIAPELEAVVMRALAKDPEDRYSTMDALLFDLEAVLPEGSDSMLIQAQFGTSLRDTPFPSQSLRMHALSSQRLMIDDKDASAHLVSSTSSRFPTAPAKRRKGPVVVAGFIAILAGGGGAYFWQRSNASEPADQTVAATETAPTPAPTTPTVPAPTPTPPPAPPAAETTPPPAEPPPVEPTVAEPTATAPAPVVPKRVVGPATPAPKPAAPKIVTPPSRPAIAKAEPTAPVVQVEPAKPGSATTPAIETPTTKPGSAAAEPKPAVEVPVAPKELPRPAPGSAVPPVPPPKPAVVDIGSLDATPTIASLDVNGPLPSSVVRRGVERILPSLRACYRAAAKTGQKTPPINLSLSFEIDENSAATNVSAARGTAFGTLQGCVRGAVSRLTTQQAPDVGTVQVQLAITFKPT